MDIVLIAFVLIAALTLLIALLEIYYPNGVFAITHFFSRLKLFCVNDEEWVAAYNPKHAQLVYCQHHGMNFPPAVDDELHNAGVWFEQIFEYDHE